MWHGDRARDRGHRRSVVAAAALVFIGGVGCSTTSTGGDATAGDGGGGPPVSEPADEAQSDDLAVALPAVCRATDERIDALPAPPEQMTRADWAAEVGAAYRDEARALERFVPEDPDVRNLLGTYVDTTQELAAAWADLARVLRDDPDRVGEVRDDITELALGRDDTAEALAAVECRRSTDSADDT